MPITQDLREYDQNKQLWNLSERLVVEIPREGERVLYFIQGHIEQQSLSTKKDFDHKISHFNLPSQILCRVINTQLLVEPTTSEIYFQFTLLPDIESDPTVPDPIPPEIQKHEVQSLYKILTASVSGTSEDSARLENPIPSSVISSQSMQLGVLATASHAIMTGTMFMVYCKQRASQFVIRLNKYLQAVNNNIHVGMRFKMRFQREDLLEISSFGIIIGIEDSCPEWPNSRWRSLKVYWEEPATFQRPERVSLWEIELVTSSGFGTVSDPTTVKSKMLKPHYPSSKLTSNSTGLDDSSSFLFEPKKNKANNTSAVRSFCNWFCCCFK